MRPMANSAFRLTIHAGPHDRRHCPVSVPLPEPFRLTDWELQMPDGAKIALQVLPNGEGVFILPELPAGAVLTLPALPAPDTSVYRPPHVVLEEAAGMISLNIDGALLTRYHYAHVPARPYFYPLLTGDAQEVTRAFPMRTDVPGESSDHPHHRSLWIAFGDVSGADNWSEEPGHASTRHDSLDALIQGDACGQFATTGTWLTPEADPLLTQRLTVTAWATPADFRLLDFDIELAALQDSVLFGDTKEGGILSVRVVGTMDVPRGGTIENSYGGLDEAETWGKAAHWCDYSGPVEDTIQGIAVMDHPLSFRYPTHWHVRNYGLMTANPFAYAAYTAGAKNGAHRLVQGEKLRFRYRLLVHTGDATAGCVRTRYLDFVSPPRVQFTPNA